MTTFPKNLTLQRFTEYRLNGMYYSVHDKLFLPRIVLCPKQYFSIDTSGLLKSSHVYVLYNSDRADYINEYISHMSHCSIFDESQLNDLEKKVLSEGKETTGGLKVL